MVDSRQKGARAETALKKLLIEKTGLTWERTPGSGALNERHKLKGDLYIPGKDNKFCIEVKHYKEDHLTSKVLTDKEPQLLKWWNQAENQAYLVQKDPLLIFKFDRSKWFIAYTIHAFDGLIDNEFPEMNYKHFILWIDEGSHPIYITKLENFLGEKIKWIL